MKATRNQPNTTKYCFAFGIVFHCIASGKLQTYDMIIYEIVMGAYPYLRLNLRYLFKGRSLNNSAFEKKHIAKLREHSANKE